MKSHTAVESKLSRDYSEKAPGSAERYRRARQLFPSGVTHDARYLLPHPLFISRAEGAYKWDVDGNQYVDYFGGHGSLILGHSHPAVVDAVQRQASRGTHLGASHDLEIEWASLICDMVPSAERVRFTASGTEATHLALRVARAFTGKPSFVRLAGHFHGWHDHVAFGGSTGPVSRPAGILQEIVNHAIVCPPDDIALLKNVFETRDDLAAVILEPTGASFGHVPMQKEFLAELVAAAKSRGVVVIFDEVISGFRCAPGGAQEYFGITPDLTALAKIVAGGYPGGALVGSAEVMEVMQYKSFTPPPVAHQGTFNGNPISASAGIATLKLIQNSDVIERANCNASNLRRELNSAIRAADANWSVYGDFSAFHIFAGGHSAKIEPDAIQAGKVDWRLLKGISTELVHQIRMAFLCNGVDVCNWPGGWISCMHDARTLDRTASAFEVLLKLLVPLVASEV